MLDDAEDESCQPFQSDFVNLDEQGLDVGFAATGAWTGSDFSGTYWEAACKDWTANAANETGASGSVNLTDERWTDNNALSSSQELRFYCFEIAP